MEEETLTLSPLFLPTLIIILFLTIILLKKKLAHTTPGPTLPPGPTKLPIIGNLHQLAFSSLLPHHRFRDLAQQHGPDGLMHLQIGETSNVVVSSPEIAQLFMKAHDLNFATRPIVQSASIILYDHRDVAFAPYGEYWRQMRKICTLELMSTKRVGSQRPIREEEVRKAMVGSIRPGEVVNLGRILGSLVCKIIWRAAFGGVEAREMEEAFFSVQHRIVQALGELSLRDVFPSSWVMKMVAGRNDRRLKKLHAESDTILQEIIDAHVSRRRSDVDRAAGGGDDQDLVDVLLNFTHDQAVAAGGFSVTDFEIKAVITDIFFGGTHTSSVTIEWVMSELMRNPEEMEKAQKEVRRVFDGKGKAVDEASIDELHYMKLIVRETLRLHPPLPLLVPRESRETVVIKGYQIPAKTKVAINVWAIGRDPAYWIEPDKFMPERFVNSPVNYNGDDFQLLPFGAGRRMCPGVKTGMAIVHLAVANLLYHFDWKLPNEMKPEDLDMTEVFGIVVGRKNDLHLIPTPYRAP
ncbi:unnamed protein product [Linum tenue]|uniref:Cytochrome P450 n=2 Tax=Linum tenue TaxID=586396 RepID=A0AAV0QC39_9ROSI|nr:unnamed protein product [Linum tenue]